MYRSLDRLPDPWRSLPSVFRSRRPQLSLTAEVEGEGVSMAAEASTAASAVAASAAASPIEGSVAASAADGSLAASAATTAIVSCYLT